MTLSPLHSRRRTLPGRTVLALAFGLSTLAPPALTHGNSDHDRAAGVDDDAPLVRKVRLATARFRNIDVATAEGWVRATPCVSGPSSGAMGVHLVLPPRVGDGTIDADEPEALIYEPMPNGRMRLVGVEYIVLAADWARLNPAGGAPSVDGHLMNYVGEPNRYGLPAFYELHVWGWKRNPNGSFADWNSEVTCDHQPA
jgi:hypothetical protein